MHTAAHGAMAQISDYAWIDHGKLRRTFGDEWLAALHRVRRIAAQGSSWLATGCHSNYLCP